MLAAEPDPAALNRSAIGAMRAGDWRQAVTLLERATGAEPEAPELWMNLAAAWRGLGDQEAERRALLRALEADQRHFEALVRLAQVHERLGERAQAADRWRGVLALARQAQALPDSLTPVLEHARAYVAEADSAFAAAVDAGLSDARAGLSPAELRRFDACVGALTGRRRIYVNDPQGMHFPFLPADEFFDRSHFPWLPELEKHTPTIRAELEALLHAGSEGMVPYVAMDKGTPPNKWSALDHRLDWSAFFLWKFGERQEENCARAPETARIVEGLPLADMPGRAPTAFFSILRPRTRLPAHTGVTNLRAIIHLPLIVPPGCGFRVGGETREWREGEAFAFDDTIDHEAWNDSDAPRGILIIDAWNPHLTAVERDLVRTLLRVADSSGHRPVALERRGD